MTDPHLGIDWALGALRRLYRDRPFDEWPRFGAEDAPALGVPLDREALLAAAPAR